MCSTKYIPGTKDLVATAMDINEKLVRAGLVGHARDDEFNARSSYGLIGPEGSCTALLRTRAEIPLVNAAGEAA